MVPIQIMNCIVDQWAYSGCLVGEICMDIEFRHYTELKILLYTQSNNDVTCHCIMH